MLSVLNFKAQFEGRLAVWSVINNHLRSPHKSISTFPFLLKPSSIYNVASIRTCARPCRFRRSCYFREVRIYGKLDAMMWHPSNLSIDFITLQEVKLQNLLFSWGLLKPNGYFIKIRRLTCNCCSIECYSPVVLRRL